MSVLSVPMVLEECVSCSMPFAVTEEFQRRRMEDKQSYCCPSGHWQAYQGKTDKQRLKEERDRAARLQAELDQKQAALRDAYNGLPGAVVAARHLATRYGTRQQVAFWKGYRDAECGGKSEDDSGYPKAFGWHAAWVGGFRLRRKQMGMGYDS